MPFGNSTANREPAFIVNRNAGGFRRDRKLEGRLLSAIGSRGRVYVTDSNADLTAAVADTVRTEAAPVVFCGGDGTYLAGVTALARVAAGALPPIALVRAGTVSIVAQNWGAHSDAVARVRAFAEAPASLRYVERPTLSVAADDGVRVGFTFGTGLVARFFEEYDRTTEGGVVAAFGIVVRLFVDSLRGGPYANKVLSPLPCRITVDGALLAPEAWSLVVASVLRDVGMHMLVNHRAAEDAERPHLVASPLPPRALGAQWPLVALGQPLIGKRNFDGLVRSFRLDFPERGPYVLDGDTFHTQSVTVTAGPRIRVAT
jgi:diacylglycerol kinase family enzyme